MLSIFNKKNISTPLFVTSSIVAFIILFGLYSVVKISFRYSVIKNVDQIQNINEDDSYQATVGDPFITRNPDARPLIDSPVVSFLDPSMGDEKAPVVIVEFSEYECDFCQKQEQVLKKVLQKYKDKVKLVWKDYPNREPTSSSFRAAVAARCADEQDKFWPYHDFLFEQNDDLTRENFINIATLLELNLDDFESCIDDPEMNDVVEDNMIEANDLNITGVPFFYVNKQEIMGQISEEKLEKIVKIEIERNQK